MSSTLQLYGLQPAILLCPWDSAGKNIGVDCHVLLQGIFPTQGSNPQLLCPLDWQAGFLPLVHLVLRKDKMSLPSRFSPYASAPDFWDNPLSLLAHTWPTRSLVVPAHLQPRPLESSGPDTFHLKHLCPSLFISVSVGYLCPCLS